MENLKEKFHKLSLSSLTNLFHSFGSEEGVSAKFLWRTLLGVMILLAVFVGAFALFSYRWATEELPLPPVDIVRASFSIDELHNVITLYHSKEQEYQKLLYSRPPAPQFGFSGVASFGE